MKIILNISFLFFIVLFGTNVYAEESFAEFENELQVEERVDPLSGFNRVMTTFNDTTYRYLLSPVAKTYKDVVHKDIRKSVDNFFHNILFPVRFVNNLLQFKFQNTVDETGRFLINSTVGFLGFFDPAREQFNLQPHNEDFGQTLGYWGVGTGFHIVWPFLGPSNLRDSIGSFGVDSYLDPLIYYEDRPHNLLNSYEESLGIKFYKQINYTSLHYGEYENLTKDAIDLYPFLRDSYEQYRAQQIKE